MAKPRTLKTKLRMARTLVKKIVLLTDVRGVGRHGLRETIITYSNNIEQIMDVITSQIEEDERLRGNVKAKQ